MTLKERTDIAKEIYEKKLTVMEAAVKYNINFYTARSYLREYKARIKELKINL